MPAGAARPPGWPASPVARPAADSPVVPGAGIVVVARAGHDADAERQRGHHPQRRQAATSYWLRDRTVSRIFSAADGMAFSRRFMSHWSRVIRRIDERAITVALRRSSSSRPISPK